MKEFIIVTDSTTDLPSDYVKMNGVRVVPLKFIIDDKSYRDFPDKRELSTEEFYSMIKDGKVVKTSQPNPEEFYNVFNSILDLGYGILGIFFSSGLSGTFNSARIAKDQMLYENPNAPIYVIDSLCASLGEGLLVHYALKMKDEGMCLSDLADYVENLKLKIAHWYTIADMDTLKRGGRISASSAFFAKTLNINPVLHVSTDGKLIAKMKKIGRKNALNALVDKMVETYIKDENEVVFISHSCASTDVEKVVEMIKEKTGINNFLINDVGPVIGAHCGVGTVAIFYLANER